MNSLFQLQNYRLYRYLNKALSIMIFIFTIVVLLFSLGSLKKKGYELFVEFSSAYGLKKGTSVNLKGVTIGSVYNISVMPNKVVVLIHINSSDTLIARSSLIEVNQVGLFNDIVVDITSTYKSIDTQINVINPTSLDCLDSYFICSNFYIRGYKGLNYDDLVRATTRIAQRFDDPRFFNLFYVLLQNSIEISNEMIEIIMYVSYFFSYLSELSALLLFKYFV